MKKFYVIGDPIDHSLSPILQRYFLEQFHIIGEYKAKRVSIDKLESAIEFFIQRGVSGVNVTTPLKEKILEFADELTPEAETIGSVNTIQFYDEKVIGHNTDAIGFQQSLAGFDHFVTNKNAIVFGAGGAARAIVIALIRSRCKEIMIVNRNFAKAFDLAKWATDRFPTAQVEALPSENQIIATALPKCHLLVNATTVGIGNLVDRSVLPPAALLPEKMMVYDLIYRPYRTKLIQQAEQQFLLWQNGLDMLIYQGLESLKFWLGQELTLDHARYTELREMLRRETCRE